MFNIILAAIAYSLRKRNKVIAFYLVNIAITLEMLWVIPMAFWLLVLTIASISEFGIGVFLDPDGSTVACLIFAAIAIEFIIVRRLFTVRRLIREYKSQVPSNGKTKTKGHD